MEAAPAPQDRLAALDREAHVWLYCPDAVAEASTLAGWRTLLSTDECRRLDRFRREKDRRHFLAAHALVRLALSHYTSVPPAEWRFEAGRHGRPEIASPPVPELRFSLAHTPGLVACVVTHDCECGIDAEAVGRRANLTRLAQRVLSASERGDWEALPESERRLRFLVYWTLKEAYLKARGLGLSLPPRDVSFALREAEIRLEAAPPADLEFEAWRFSTMRPTSEHTLATALRRNGRPTPTVVVKEGRPKTA